MIGKIGTIVSWTIIRVPPANFGYQAPYIVALVVLEAGGNITAQLVDCDVKDLRFGQRVVTIVRRTIQSDADAVIPYGIKVKPL